MSDVHTTHCCIFHGCKYGKDDVCTVVCGRAPQEYPCEVCYICQENLDDHPEKKTEFFRMNGARKMERVTITRTITCTAVEAA